MHTPRQLIHRLEPLCGTILLALMLLTQAACQNRYDRGMDAIAEQRFEEARQSARIGKKEEPKNPRYDLLMAQSYVKEAEAMTQAMSSNDSQPPMELKKVQQRYKKALPHAQAAFDSGELTAEAGRILGKIHWELENPIDAVDTWRAARQADPTAILDGDYLQALRTALGRVTFFEDHIKALELRHELQEFVDTHQSLVQKTSPETQQSIAENLSKESFRKNREAVATQYATSKRTEDAIALYSQLIEDFPEESRYHYEKGSLLLLTGKDEEAVKSFEKYATHHDTNEHTQRLRDVAQLSERYGIISVALTFYNKLLKSQKEPSTERANVYLKLVDLHLALGDLKEARTFIDAYLEDLKALQGDPISPGKYLTLASKARQFSQPELAIALLEEAINASTPNLKVVESLAESYAQKAEFGNVERVLKDYTERVQQQDPSQYTVALNQAASWAERRQNYELAQFFYERLLEVDANNPRYLLDLAELMASQNKRDEILVTLERYLKASKNTPHSLKQAARIYQRLRMFKEAETLYKKLIDQKTSNLAYANSLADLYSEWGKIELIPESYTKYLKSRNRDANDLLAIARRLRQFGYAEQAIPYLEEAAQKNNPTAWLMLADIYQSKSRLTDLKKALQNYLDNADDRMRALQEVLPRYRQANLTVEATNTLEELLKLPNYEKNTVYIEQLSSLYLSQGRQSDALDLWTRYVTSSTNISGPLEDMYRVFNRRQQLDWLLDFYKHLMDEGIASTELYHLVGKTYLELSRSNQNFSKSKDLRRKAEIAFTAHLEKSKLSERDLLRFAGDLQHNQFYALAEHAYQRYLTTREEKGKSIQPKVYMGYAEVLLELKQYNKAQKMLLDYLDKNNSYGQKLRVAKALIQYENYQAAEPILSELFNTAAPSQRSEIFKYLFDIYSKNKDNAKLAALTGEYLDLSPSIATAREDIYSKAQSYGQTKLMLEQLEQITRTSDLSKRYALGFLHWQLGQQDDARRIWESWISSTSADKVAANHAILYNFYKTHGHMEEALEHLHKAVTKSTPESAWAYQAELAYAYVISGDVDKATQTFDVAVEQVEKNQPGQLARVILKQAQALYDAGYTRHAESTAELAQKLSVDRQEAFLMFRAELILSSGDTTRAERIIQEIVNSTTSAQQSIPLLLKHGYIDDAIKLIEQESQSGDYVAAGLIITQHKGYILRAYGVDTLERLLQPIMSRSREDTSLERDLGIVLLDQGFTEKGIALLNTVRDTSPQNRLDGSLTLMLVQAYLRIEEPDQAHQVLIDYLSQIPDTIVLNYAMSAYIASGHQDALFKLLNHMTQSKRLASLAFPELIQLLCQNGNTLDAISLLRSLTTQDRESTKADLYHTQLFDVDISKIDRNNAFLQGVAALGQAGYTSEALSLLEFAPQAIKLDSQYYGLKAWLQLASQQGTTNELVELLVKSYPMSTQALLNGTETEKPSEQDASFNDIEEDAKLRLGQHLLYMGQTESIAEMLTPLIKSHDPQHAYEALRILVGLNFVKTGNPQPPEELLRTYIDSRYNDYQAERNVAQLMITLGADAGATDVVTNYVDYYSTLNNREMLMTHAVFTGDTELFHTALDAYWDSAEDPTTTVKRIVLQSDEASSYKLLKPALDKLATDHTQASFVASTRASLLFKEGNTQEAREHILQRIKDTNNDPYTIEQLIHALLTQDLSSEVAKAIYPALVPESITPKSHLYIGLSFADLGDEKNAMEHLDLYIRNAQNQGIAAATIAEQLVWKKHHKLAKIYGQKAFQYAPNTPLASYWKGMTHLLDQDPKQAREHIDLALSLGLANSHILLPQTIHAALETNQLEIAKTYTKYILKTNIFGTGAAIRTWARSEHAKEGLHFFEAELTPVMANLMSMPTNELVIPLTGLYEAAGYPDQTFRIYNQLIQQNTIATFESKNSIQTSYLNNLAYAHSTSNLELDTGLSLSLRSIALDSPTIPTAYGANRSATFLDTLGWLEFQKGNIKEAERLITQAIQSTKGNLASAELYDHLADIYDKQGKHEEAIWLRIHADSFENASFPPLPNKLLK